MSSRTLSRYLIVSDEGKTESGHGKGEFAQPHFEAPLPSTALVSHNGAYAKMLDSHRSPPNKRHRAPCLRKTPFWLMSKSLI
jgi:hypothetical protein